MPRTTAGRALLGAVCPYKHIVTADGQGYSRHPEADKCSWIEPIDAIEAEAAAQERERIRAAIGAAEDPWEALPAILAEPSEAKP